ncbi:hypothetical protein DH2020_021611 [Rehmannia glutinosa]|uniref:Uncharacterized protein n=1 Tax=Rehmannia glutinosa TaxID=99300 RepID=A0ABR0WDD1_REHGL
MAAEPVSKNSSMGDTQVDGKPFVDFNVDSRELSGANSACTSEHDFRTSSVSTNVESVRVEEGDDCGWPNGSSDSDNKALVEVSDGHHGKDNEGEGLILPEDNFYNKNAEDGGANSSEVRCTAIEMKVEPSGNVFNHSVDLFSSMQKESGCQKELPLQQNGHFASVESSMLFSVNEYQRYLSTVALSSVGANGISEKHSQKVGRTGDCQQHLPGYSLSDFVEPSQILRGYPVSMQTVKEINGDVNCVKHVPLQNVPKWDGKLHSDRHTEFSLQKCTTGLRHQSEVVPFPSQESTRDHCTPQSGCSPDVDKPPSRNGYVKLFGKILVPPQERTNSCTQGNGDENGQHHKAGHNSLNLKFSGDQKVNLDSFQSKVDCNNYLASENIPFKNYSCWDENRTQAAIFPPLPDSTLFEIEQTPLNGVIRTNNDHPFNGVSVFPSREMSSTNNGIADYQFINRELQPFTIYMKQPQEVLFSEMQRRNGFGIVQGMQQQA